MRVDARKYFQWDKSALRDECISLAKRLEAVERERDEQLEILNAVAHIGVDFGYGDFQLNDGHIEKARELLARESKP